MYEYKNGNATIVIHSPLMKLTEDERRNWYKEEMEKDNPTLKRIAQAVNDCYKRR